MANGRKRGLILAPAFGGGKYKLTKFAPNKDDRDDLIAIFGAVGSGIRELDMDANAQTLARSDTLIKEIESLHEDGRKITISTHSGGGFVVRCAMSKLRAERPDLYDSVELITIKDGAVRGALFPLYLHYMASIGAHEENAESNSIEVDFGVSFPPSLNVPIAREILFFWPTNYSEDWKTRTSINEAMIIESHADRYKLLEQIGKWDCGQPWGEGIHKASYSNGSTKPFFDGNTLVNFAASKGSLANIGIESKSTGVEGAYLYFSIGPWAHIKGTSVEKINLSNAPSPAVTDEWESAPGSYLGDISVVGPAIISKATQAAQAAGMKIDEAEAQNRVSYIPTVSALDIGLPPKWIETASDAEIKAASGFDEIRYGAENLNHGHDQWVDEIIARVKEGPV